MSSTIFLNDRQTKNQGFDTANLPQSPSFFTDLVRSVFYKRLEGTSVVVLLTAPDRGCGVSFASSCIVAELASTGVKVLLADAQALPAMGNGKLALSRCERVGPGRVWVLGHQQIPPAELDTTKEPASPLAILEALQQEFTHIVIDAPALTVSDLALLLGTSVTGVILVAKAGRTETQAITRSYNRLISLGANVFGSVYSAR